MAPALISIIVPILNEAQGLLPFYEHLSSQESPWELILVDASATSSFPPSLQNLPQVTLLHSSLGRGKQMNVGGSASQGEILFFLHVDLRLPSKALQQIREAISHGYCGGGFFKKFTPSHFLLLVNQFFLNWIRTRLFRSMVGTNGIFCSRAVFQKMQGFREWPFLEDVDFSDRLKKQGLLKFFKTPILVSARKYQKEGVWKRTFKNIYILFLFRFLQKDPHSLVKYYASDPASSTLDSGIIS
ncbi:MAG: TIGR04283 family arsenosugar biosynthesis glycosyltransferase [Planctomycetota bacterium]